MRLACSALLALVLALAAGCGRDAAPSAGARMTVYAALPPVAYLVERVGGEHVEVDALVSGGQDPHTFEPTLKQIYALGAARAYFGAGMPFEPSIIERVADDAPDLVVVDLAHGEDAHAHDAAAHEEDGHDHDAHHHGGMDPHFWLAPGEAREAARTIAQTLSTLDPVNAPDYERNVQALVRELDAVDAELREQLAPLKGRRFYVYHPAFGHFAAAYGLKQVAVEFQGKSPSIKQIGELIESAKEDGVRVIFVQPQFGTEAAQTVADAIGGAVVSVDPLERDLVANLRNLAGKLHEALSPGEAE